jgi:uracil-DNA glycosylase
VVPLASSSDVQLQVPKEFLALARQIIAYRSEERFSWAYKLLWRLQEQPQLLHNPADADVHHVRAMAKSVSRDCHKMKAFVRFRELQNQTQRQSFGAWFEPDHYIMELTGPFFARRFADMDWVISTPHAVAIFFNGALSYAPPDGVRHADDDMTEELWRTYYSNIFNPARLKVKAMESEMPKKYWKNLPEAHLIPDLIAGAAQRVQTMRDQTPTSAPAHLAKFKALAVNHPTASEDNFTSLNEARAAAVSCTRCSLHCNATQTVFGEGNENANIMFVGEQPGDQEDIAGTPFVGPAGQIFDEALVATGIPRSKIYLTNAVKHFKFTVRGKSRIHERPSRSEIQRCKWWLDRELDLVRPKLVVAMGATALFALTGQSDGIKNLRGLLQKPTPGLMVLPTYHPAAILRNRDDAQAIKRDFFADFSSIPNFLTQI